VLDGLKHIRRTLPNAHLHVEMSALPAAILDTNLKTALRGYVAERPAQRSLVGQFACDDNADSNACNHGRGNE
jgi:hypothetical protein